jgi:hypothetical protein
LFSTIAPGATVWILSNTRNGSATPWVSDGKAPVRIIHHLDLLAREPAREQRRVQQKPMRGIAEPRSPPGRAAW